MEIPKAAHDCVHRCLGKKAGRYEQKSHEYYYGVNGLGIKLCKHTYIYFIGLFFFISFFTDSDNRMHQVGKYVVKYPNQKTATNAACLFKPDSIRRAV